MTTSQAATPEGDDEHIGRGSIDLVSADGSQFTAVDEGQGMPIVIVHPGAANAASWGRVARHLSSRFRVLRFDRRPYRKPAEIEQSATIAGEVDDVLSIAHAVGIPALLVGHSSGGVVALEAALASPSSFAGLVLYEPPVAVTEPLGGDALLRANAALSRGDPGQAMTIHLREIVEAPMLLVRLLPLFPPLWRRMTMQAAGQIADDNALESLGVGIDRYAQIELPTLLLSGSRSPKHLHGRLDALAAVLPHAESVILEGQGHIANARAPKKVADVIAAFADTVMR